MISERQHQVELVRARYSAFATKMPPFYAFLTVETIAIMAVFRGRQPVLDSLIIPLLIVAVTSFRGIWWHRHRHDKIPVKVAQRRLHRALALLIGGVALGVGMCFALLTVASAEERQFLSLIFMLSGLVGFCCLIHLRYMALLCSTMLLSPAIGLYFSTSSMTVTLSGLILVSAMASLATCLMSHYNEFTALIRSKLDLHRLSEENIRLVSLDMLTDVPNRRHFFHTLTAALAEGGNRRLAVGIVDLDGFRQVNDCHGHKIGDAVLKETARRLCRTRPDVTGLSRIGGDEFAFLVEDTTDDTALIRIGEALVEATQQPIVVDDLTVSISCSIGLASRSRAADSADILFEFADVALHHAKQTGSRSVIFSAKHRAAMREEDAIVQALRTADLDRELAAVFQPIVEIRSGRVLAFECLARWRSPTLGTVSPATFIPISERTGLITPITLVMLGKALAAMQDWPPNVNLSFNLSSHDIICAVAIRKIVTLLQASGISPARVAFELTETALLNDFSAARSNIDLIKAMGAEVALDDFGTGCSSLSHVKNLPLNKLKIDRRFVADIETNATSRMIVQSLVTLCQGIGVDCIVEGAETRGQVSTLSGLGCKVVQGYFYAPPVEHHEVPALLEGFAPKALLAG